jgi:SAM-dependent methyltransferase
MPIRSAYVDVVVNDAVFEHCRDLEAVLQETHRLLKPGGYLYATYGPLWFCFGGDHFSGRGGLVYGYHHLQDDRAAYARYFQEQRLNDEDAQSGGRYVLLDLFSKLATKDYLDLYEKTGFEMVDLILEVSKNAVSFCAKWPDRVEALLKSYPRLCRDDLIIKTHLIILRKV